MNSESALKPGVVLAGKYRIERILGQGGMGVVAAAQHIQLDQRVALKLMLPEAMHNAEAVARFVREARAAARITSDHVARVFDVAALDSGEPYIVMEYLEGADVGQLLARYGAFPVEQAVDYLLQACEALAEAHAAGIVHRDLKPANLFVAERVDGQRLVKILDFGISKMSDPRQNAPSTKTSALMGTPLYMSPEQMGSSKHVDARSDVWSLGVVLYEMLSGTPPFTADTLPQVCAMVISQPPPPLVERSPSLPPLVYEVVARCLKKDPSARFQSVAELAQALEPITSARARQSVDRIFRVQGRSTRPPPSHAVAGVTDAAAAMPGTYAPWGETRAVDLARRRAAPIIMVSLLVLLLVGGGVWLMRRSSTVSQPTTALSSTTLAAATAMPPILSAPATPVADPPPVVASAASASASATAKASPATRVPEHRSNHSTRGARVATPEAAKPASTPAAPPATATLTTPAPASPRSRL